MPPLISLTRTEDLAGQFRKRGGVIGEVGRSLSFGKKGNKGIALVGLRAGRIEAGLRSGCWTRTLLRRGAGKQRRQIDRNAVLAGRETHIHPPSMLRKRLITG